MLLKEDIVDIGKPDWICLFAFVVSEFSGLFLHPSIFSIIHSRSAINSMIINGALPDFWYSLNSNILVFSKGIIMLQKSLSSHTLLCDWTLFFVGKEWKQFRQ